MNKRNRSIKRIGGIVVLAVTFATGAAGAGTFGSGQSYYGQPADAAATGRVVDIDAARYLNVRYGETVTFRSGSRQFAWTFNGLDRRAVDVAKIAPSGFSSKPFLVHIAENPLIRQ
ncbi:MAG: CzcE family metal-binding protein [Rubrivivax sp.]